MARPKVSIITPSYNSVRFIENTIKSVQAQDYPHLEHIVMDGGSTDGSLEILMRYQGIYNLNWRSEPDHGQSHALNKAVHIGSGEWFLFLNSDDFLIDKSAITRAIKKIKENPGYQVYMGHINTVDIDGKFLYTSSHYGKTILDKQILLYELPLCIHQATLTHKEIFNHVGYFNEIFRLHMDYEFLLRSSDITEIKLLDTVVAAMRKHPGAKTQQRSLRSPIELIIARSLNHGKLFSTLNMREFKRFSRLLVSNLFGSKRCNSP
jgi:glycosyltransferase involved in cell wall biosynthesis